MQWQRKNRDDLVCIDGDPVVVKPVSNSSSEKSLAGAHSALSRSPKPNHDSLRLCPKASGASPGLFRKNIALSVALLRVCVGRCRRVVGRSELSPHHPHARSYPACFIHRFISGVRKRKPRRSQTPACLEQCLAGGEVSEPGEYRTCNLKPGSRLVLLFI